MVSELMVGLIFSAKCTELSATDKTFIPSLARAYFDTLVAQKDHLEHDTTSLKRNREDPKNSEELLNLKKAFKSPHCDTTKLDSFAKVAICKTPSLTLRHYLEMTLIRTNV
jgi:hypothetical protein